jgi:hypothetical protein
MEAIAVSASTVAPAALDREFLGIRCRLIALAAALDRIDRAGKPAAGDARLEQIGRSLEILAADRRDRAEQVQMVFSLPYEKGLGN